MTLHLSLNDLRVDGRALFVSQTPIPEDFKFPREMFCFMQATSPVGGILSKSRIRLTGYPPSSIP